MLSFNEAVDKCMTMGAPAADGFTVAKAREQTWRITRPAKVVSALNLAHNNHNLDILKNVR